MNYKSGDLVKITGNSNYHRFRIGETVRLKCNCGGELHVWTAEYLDGHVFWYVRESDMTPAKPATMPQKIIVTTDGKTTLARLFDGKTMVKRAEAKCAPSDVFDFGIGAELAVKRLMGAKPDAAITATEPVKENSPKSHMFSVGNKVVCLGKHHEEDPEFYPESETAGEIINTNFDFEKPYFVKWAEGSTSGNCEWWAYADDLKPYVETIRSNPEPVKESEPVKLYCVKSYEPGEWLTKGKIYACNPADNYAIQYDAHKVDVGRWDIRRIAGTPLTDLLVPLVRRPAKVGEWFVIVKEIASHNPPLIIGDLCKVTETGVGSSGLEFVRNDKGNRFYNNAHIGEYLVLDGYHGEAES